jgi:phosphopantothenoylcysteine decarboxylase/phosphopantothenate--cysteine ligase
MHPAQRILGASSKALAGRTVVLAVSGSIAAVETVALARELIRHGAQVVPVMSRAATKILHPDALEFATGRRPITRLTGQVEHVRYCGDPPREADVLVVAPATGNTVAKMALGIDDTPVTTFAAAALGSRMPVVVAPAMHLSMAKNPALEERARELRARGVLWVEPLVEEGKAKLAAPEHILAAVERAVGPSELSGRRVLVIAGPTSEALDAVRVLTNRSSGRSGAEIVRAFNARGADVTLLASEPLLAAFRTPATRTLQFSSVDSLLARLKELGDLNAFAAVVNCAAISDYTTEPREGKIASDLEPLELELRPAPRVNAAIRERFSGLLVGFKLEVGGDDGALVSRARKRMADGRLDLTVANRLEDVAAGHTRWHILPPQGDPVVVEGGKDEAARALVQAVVQRLLRA